MVPKGKWAAAVAAVGASLTLIGAYAVREAGERPGEVRKARFEQVERTNAIYLIRFAGRPVGTSRIRYERDGGVLHLVEDLQLQVPALGGQIQQADQHIEQELDDALTLRRFRFALRSGTSGHSQVTEIFGQRLQSDSLRITVRTGGRDMTRTLGAPADVVLGSGGWLRLMLAGTLEAGHRYELPELDPAALALRPVRYTVEAIERRSARELALADESAAEYPPSLTIRVFRLAQEGGGLRSTLEIAETGAPLRAVLPLGLTMERATANSLAELRSFRENPAPLTPGSVSDGATLLARSAIAAGVRLEHETDLAVLHLRASGMPLPPDADGGAQHVEEDQVWIRRLALPEPGRSGYRLGAVGSPSPLAADPRLAPNLVSEPFVEADHPEIVAAARRATAGTRDPAEATRRIARFVYNHLEKRYTASLPSAIEAFRSGEGDCNEHTVLTTALLRAAGVPARPVSGLVYANGAFYYHAWVEVWLGGTWVPIDPTFGRVPADAARLRLYVGVSRLSAVVGTIGHLQLDVLS